MIEVSNLDLKKKKLKRLYSRKVHSKFIYIKKKYETSYSFVHIPKCL